MFSSNLNFSERVERAKWSLRVASLVCTPRGSGQLFLLSLSLSPWPVLYECDRSLRVIEAACLLVLLIARRPPCFLQLSARSEVPVNFLFNYIIIQEVWWWAGGGGG